MFFHSESISIVPDPGLIMTSKGILISSAQTYRAIQNCKREGSSKPRIVQILEENGRIAE